MSIGSYGYFTAGWCSNCGRRRGPDGRCADCDPWWTSPLMQVGGPLILFVTLFLLGGATLLQQKAPGGQGTSRSVAALPASSYAINPSFSSTSYTPTYLNVPPAPATTRMVAWNAPLRPSQDELEFMELQRLRQTTAYVDAVVQAGENERAERARTGLSGMSPQTYFGSLPPRSYRRLLPAADLPDNYL